MLTLPVWVKLTVVLAPVAAVPPALVDAPPPVEAAVVLVELLLSPPHAAMTRTPAASTTAARSFLMWFSPLRCVWVVLMNGAIDSGRRQPREERTEELD